MDQAFLTRPEKIPLHGPEIVLVLCEFVQERTSSLHNGPKGKSENKSLQQKKHRTTPGMKNTSSDNAFFLKEIGCVNPRTTTAFARGHVIQDVTC